MTWPLVLFLSGTHPAPAPGACYCAMRSLDDDVRAATHVVVGRVLRIRTVPTSYDIGEHEAVLLVEASWKGATTGDTLTVWIRLPGQIAALALLKDGRTWSLRSLQQARGPSRAAAVWRP